jgi:hypothetical protein
MAEQLHQGREAHAELEHFGCVRVPQLVEGHVSGTTGPFGGRGERLREGHI